MKSLFNAIDNNEIIGRIEKLSPSSRAIWGKMSVSQALQHCQQPLKVAFGELKLKRSLLGVLFGKTYRKKLTADDQPFPRHSPTDKKFIVKDEPDFDLAKTKLILLVRKFAEKGPEGISKNVHPFFGHMTVHEWNKLMYKHLDHHLRQFGV
jgi:hypothetical protein